MKNLSLEEKAKRYDEAIEKAEKWYNAPNVDKIPTFGNRIIEDIFPELYEPEDEEVRNEIIKLVKYYYGATLGCKHTVSRDKMLTWLKKQGEQKSMKVYRVENEAEQKGLWRKFDGTYEPLFDMLTDGKCKDLPMEDSPIYREGNKRWFASAPSKETLQKWFSKKDLEELVSKGFTISEFEVAGYKKVSDFEYIFTRDNIINRNYLEVSDIYPEQKVFAPKVEPKFNVGNWAVSRLDGKARRISEVHCDEYNKYYIVEGNEYNIEEYDRLHHFWTIQDAKDGDILACKNGWTCIFKSLVNDNLFSSHCFMDSGGWFCEDGGQAHTLYNSSNIHPATKEQRDLLFQKMKESGHEWDADKKELINTL